MSDFTFNPWASKEKMNFDFINDTQKINYNMLQHTIHENMSLFSDSMSSCVRATQLMTKLNQPDEFCKSQISLLIEQGERALEHGQNILKIMEDGLRDYRKYAESLDSKTIFPFVKGESKEYADKSEDVSKDKKSSH